MFFIIIMFLLGSALLFYEMMLRDDEGLDHHGRPRKSRQEIKSTFRNIRNHFFSVSPGDSSKKR